MSNKSEICVLFKHYSLWSVDKKKVNNFSNDSFSYDRKYLIVEKLNIQNNTAFNIQKLNRKMCSI